MADKTPPEWAMEKAREAFLSAKAFCDDIVLHKAIARAFAAERERCAKIADAQEQEEIDEEKRTGGQHTAEAAACMIAAAIRANS